MARGEAALDLLIQPTPRSFVMNGLTKLDIILQISPRGWASTRPWQT